MKKYYFIYILLGVSAGAFLRPVVMYLAEFSMPEGWRNSRARGAQPFSAWHLIEPFLAAGRTVVRWIVQIVVGVATWIYETVTTLVQTYPSATVMVVVGAAVGFLMAWRRHHKRGSQTP